MWRPVLAAVLIFVAGIYVQERTGALGSVFNKTIKVYADPYWYTISRTNATINYEAQGKRLVKCTHKSPVTADLLDARGDIVSRELVRRVIDKRFPSVAEVAEDGTIIGVLKVPPEPREFTVNSYIIVTDVQTLESAKNFIIRTECFNEIDGRFPGEFGPFPIPGDGKTLTTLNAKPKPATK